MDHAVFIQTNHKQITGAIVAEYALRRYSSHNDKFDVHIVQHQGLLLVQEPRGPALPARRRQASSG